jgi:hypothetical protein
VAEEEPSAHPAMRLPAGYPFKALEEGIINE